MLPRAETVFPSALLPANLLRTLSAALPAPRRALPVETRLALVLAAMIAASLYANLSGTPAADAAETATRSAVR